MRTRPDVHPAAELFPMLSASELADLAADIRANGLLEPIVLHEGQVLDGRNRLAACERAEIEPRFVQWNGEGGSPTRFVLSHNLHRRHLTTSQRAAIAVEALPMFQEEARKRQLSGLKQGDAAPVPPNWAERRGEAREEAAALLNVGHSSVDRARQVAKADPETFERVKRGEVTVNRAFESVRERKRPKTARQQQIDDAAKRRLVAALSGITGYCRGLEEIDLRKIAAACSDEEVALWATTAGDCARTLRTLRGNLNGIRSDG